MVKLRKILAVIYLISFVLAVGSLALQWYGVEPVASFMERTRSDAWMCNILLVLLGICAVGTVGYVIRTLAQRGKNTYQKSSNELGAVSISRAAIVREVNNVIDAHPELKKQKTSVTIKNRRRPYANVEVRVAPRGSYNMAELAAGLQREIKEAVERLTGNEVRSVTVDVRRQSGDDDVAGPAALDAAEAAVDAEVAAEAPEAAIDVPADVDAGDGAQSDAGGQQPEAADLPPQPDEPDEAPQGDDGPVQVPEAQE